MIKGQTFFGGRNTYWQDHTCHKCNCLFTYEKKESELIRYVIYVDKYRVACCLVNNTFSIGIFKDKSAHYDEAYKADFIPNITPQNALNKIKTILVFQ